MEEEWLFNFGYDPFEDCGNIYDWDVSISGQINQDLPSIIENIGSSPCRGPQTTEKEENIGPTNLSHNQNHQSKLNDFHKITLSLDQVPNARDKKVRYSFGNRKILSLSGLAEEFRVSFYNLTYGKKFSKNFVQKLHNTVCSSLKLRKMNREESRSIKLYFLHFAKDGFQIINAVRNYLDENPGFLDEITESRSK